MESCAPFDATQGYAIALTRFVDCQATLLGEGGYAALSASNSPVIIALGGLLTILIAFQGYRLLLGDSVSLREAVMLAAKIGLVLAFATQWPGYRAVVYGLTVEAPQELAALLPGAGGGSGRSFPARLQTSYQAMAELTRPSPTPAPQADPQQGASAPVVPQNLPFSLAGNPVLIMAGILLLVSGLAVLITVRLIAGLLLALGPLFFACLLFDTTRGLFEGWVRALLGTAVASVTTGVLLGIEMSIIEPQLSALIQAMSVGTLPVLAPGEVLATVLIFTIALLVALGVSLRIGGGFRFVGRSVAVGGQLAQQWRTMARAQMSQSVAPSNEGGDEGRSRAALIADAIRISDERGSNPVPAGGRLEISRRMVESSDRASFEVQPTPLGQSHRRTTSMRRSKSMSQRNGTT